MATISSKVLFLTTSPRSPLKMIPEIRLLDEKFRGYEWNKETQIAFMKVLKDENFFNGKGEKDPSFSARDRINRAPKSLGFVHLKPTISLSSAGKALVETSRTEEVFLRQLLKFQLPSPYHELSDNSARFWIKPYLEIFRLIRQLGSLKFDEMKMFGLQLTDYRNFDMIVKKIQAFRSSKAIHKGSYKQFAGEYFEKELRDIYKLEIKTGDIKTREAADASIKKFLETKASNMRDYTDACFRYLRATGMVNISQVGKSISIAPEKLDEVDYFLATVDRNPCHVDNEYTYESYLCRADNPSLLTDDKNLLVQKIKKEFPELIFNSGDSVEDLKNLLDNNIQKRKEIILSQQIIEMKDYKFYDDIQNTFSQIGDNSLYDAPLMLEWNTWRAMTMLDGGSIKANLKFDDFGKPMSSAQGNMADIVCNYGDFCLSVEVTMSSGHRQFEMENESVARHLGNLKKESGKPSYCLFIAPTINESCISYFYSLHKLNIVYYGGKSTIVPLPLSVFRKMLEDSYHASYIPDSRQVQQFFEYSEMIAEKSNDEVEWYQKITEKALNWLDF